MPADKIAEANQLLAKPPVVGLALSRALGLHVVGSLAARHNITVELRPGAPVGLVALVTLPATILEHEAVPTTSEPIFAPDVGPDGEPLPLGARRVAWRPADEPPVEEWRAEGLVEPEPAHAPTVTLPLTDLSSASSAPESDAVDEPEAEPDPPVADAPLPTRVPGHHLSHQPTVENDEHDSESDPLRPYRVHELLTRHDLGKRRGRAEHDGEVVDAPTPAMPIPPDQYRPEKSQSSTRRVPIRSVSARSAYGGRAMTQLSADARNLNWLVSNFVERVPGVKEATVVSSDGLLIALSDGLDRSSGDRLAAVSAGLLSIAKGGSSPIGGGRVHEVIVEMDKAMLFVMRVSDTSVLAVTTERPCDVGLVGYEMAVLVEKCASALTPGLVSELQTVLPRSAIR